MPTLGEILSCPPWPISRYVSFLRRLSNAFGWRYVAACMLTYGINQSIGDRWVTAARRYYMLDDVGVSSKHYGQLTGFAAIPWQIKSAFGLLSDTVPIFGYRRSPYMLIAGLLGVPVVAALAFLPPSAFSYEVLMCFFLLANVNTALPDVIIDGTVAERSKQRPEHAAELQAMLWAAQNGVGVPSSLLRGYLIESGGPRLMFGLSILPMATVLLPPLLGWIEERQPAGEGRPRSGAAWLGGVRRSCGAMWRDPTRWPIAAASLLISPFAVGLGLINNLAADWAGLTAFNLLADWALSLLVYVTLRKVDTVLAKAVVYFYLANAVVPYSPALFQWYHGPGADSSDHRCLSAAACEEAAAAAAALPSAPPGPPLPFAPPLPPPVLSVLNVSSDTSVPPLECGWARLRDYPCISPVYSSWLSVAGYTSFLAGMWCYLSFFQHWSFRKLLIVMQLLITLLSFTNLLWVLRVNLRLGIPDWAWMLLGDEILVDFVHKIHGMPMYVIAAKLCPDGMEASMFALFMGLGNFGGFTSDYLGSGMIQLFGGVTKPEYRNLAPYVALLTSCKALPILLVPLLVPKGTPKSTAVEMGASPAIYGNASKGGDKAHGGDGGVRTSAIGDDGGGRGIALSTVKPHVEVVAVVAPDAETVQVAED